LDYYVKKDNKTRFISGYKFSLNTHSIGEIFDDKYGTYEVLKKSRIPVIKHMIMYSEDNHEKFARNNNDYSLIFKFFHKYNNNIVLKPNTGTCGRGVYHITKESEILPVVNELFVSNYSISLCPFYNIKAEYRLIVLDNECVLMYGKKKPTLIGNGVNSIRELLLDFNYNYFKNKLNNPMYDKILEKGEIYEYGWQFNLSKGSICFNIEDKKLRNKLLKFCKKVTNKIDLNFCSLDIIDTDNGLYVMEINSGIMMKNYINIMPNGKQIAKEIYTKAVLNMFEK
jgi:glutathione synthase/RimK-type ligase-like ATP-grasp enzyme